MSLTPLPRFLLPSRARVRIVLLAVLGAMALGTVAFHLIEGWSILDSLYVTAQTVTTVGFGDIAPRTILGRAFATVFMMVGVGVVLYALTSTVQSIVHSELFARYGHSRKMSKLRDHFIICGAGRVGSHLIRSLRAVDGEFVVNPTISQLDDSDMDMIVAGTADNIIMVEGGSREVSEAEMLAALDFAMGHIREIVRIQRELVGMAGGRRTSLTATSRRNSVSVARQTVPMAPDPSAVTRRHGPRNSICASVRPISVRLSSGT